MINYVNFFRGGGVRQDKIRRLANIKRVASNVFYLKLLVSASVFLPLLFPLSLLSKFLPHSDLLEGVPGLRVRQFLWEWQSQRSCSPSP